MSELEAGNRQLRQALAAARDLMSDAWHRVGPDWRIVERTCASKALAG